MPRRPRRSQHREGACYHVMNRGHDCRPVFADEQDSTAFLDLLAAAQERFACPLYHYCLIGNHFHLLLRLARPEHLSPLVAGLLRSYVHHVHRRYGFVGHLWQGRFKSPAVEGEGYLLSCGRYIERNPMAAGLVEEPWEYRWSSCRVYASGERDPLVSRNPYYWELSADAEGRRQRWRAFLLGADEREVAIRRDDWAVGGEGHRRRLRVERGRAAQRGRGRPLGQAPPERLSQIRPMGPGGG